MLPITPGGTDFHQSIALLEIQIFVHIIEKIDTKIARWYGRFQGARFKAIL
jgi:hypothetical protein